MLLCFLHDRGWRRPLDLGILTSIDERRNHVADSRENRPGKIDTVHASKAFSFNDRKMSCCRLVVAAIARRCAHWGRAELSAGATKLRSATACPSGSWTTWF